ncbi:MAG: AAA family ATPase, partial [Gammaproteobacteria bacterium]
VDAMVAEFPGLSRLQDQLRLGNRAEVPFNHLTDSELTYLQDLYRQAGPDMQSQAAMIATLQHALNDDEEKFTADDLERLVPAIARYLIDGAVRGWLFRVNDAGRTSAYLITRLDYTPPGEEEAGRILIEL